MPRFFLVFVIATLAGCAAPLHYVKPGITQTQADRDLAQCRYEAARDGNYNSGSTRRGISGAAGQGFAEGVEQAIRQGELMQLCMTARGYAAQRR